MLTASRLTRRFGDRLAVSDVSFDLTPGEINVVLMRIGISVFDRESILTRWK